MTPAKALAPLSPQITLSGNVTAHTAIVGKTELAIEGVAVDEDDTGELSEEDLRRILDAGLALALFQPSLGPELMIRLGVTDAVLEGIDVGVRYNGQLVKGDVKLQLWADERDFQQLAVHVGYAYHLSIGSEILNYLTLSEFSRQDISASLAWGFEYGDWVKFYLNPHFIASQISADSILPGFIRDRLPQDIQERDPSQFFGSSWMYYVGGNSGLMLGYKYVFINLELAVMRLLFQPEILDQRRDLDSWVFAPSAGLTVTW